MRRLARAALLAAALPALAASDVAPILDRAQLWESRGRDDLAREEVDKALRIAPRDPDALLRLGRLQLRANQDREAAATLERLRQAGPGHPGVAQLEALLRIRGPDRDRLRQARQLARAGRVDEAAGAYRAIFPDGFPDDDLALEYAQVLGGTKGGWDRAHAQLTELARRHPGDARYQVAVASHASTRKPVSAATYKALRELSKDPAVLVSRQAVEAWRRAVLALDPVEESLPLLRDYIAANPGETAVAERLEEMTRAVERERRQRNDPGLRARREGLAAFEAGRLDEAGARLAEATRIYPDDADAVGTLGLVRMREERHAEAASLFARAAELDPPARAKWLRLEGVSRYWLTVGRARDAREAGRLAEAEALAREAIALDPKEGYASVELARVLVKAGREAEARGLLPTLPMEHRAAIQGELRTLEAARLKAEGEAHAKAGRASEAIAALEKAAALDARDPWLRLDLARLYAAGGDEARGEALFRELLARDGADADANKAYGLYRSALQAAADGREMARARALRESGDTAGALAIYRARPHDPEARLATIDLLLDAGDVEAARTLIEAALAATPDEARALSLAGRLAILEDRVDDAVRYEQRAMALAPRADEAWRERRLAGLLDRQKAWAAGALDALHRAGTPGKSRLDAQELVAAGRQGWTPTGSWLFRAALARVDAGTLDAGDAYEVSTFGSLLLCGAACTPGAVPPVEQGLALAVGYERDAWRADLGTSPLGFPVVNVVGGVSHRGDVGPFSYTVEAARRPLPSSLLSYAGTRDPNTGRTWGGVVTTGARANLSRDSGGNWGAWSVAGLYAVTGRNVKDNAKAELMLGGYRRLVNEENRLLTLGLTGMLWRFRDNAGEFTFGHGGYYSPRSYRSLGLPLVYAMRTATSSFMVRASVSVAWSTTDRAAYFPTDPALQAAAEALAPATGVDPYYPGGDNGRSYGRSFAAAWERQVAPSTFVGARIDVERSTNYTPSRFFLYVRWTPDGPAARPVSMPPEPGWPGFGS